MKVLGYLTKYSQWSLETVDVDVATQAAAIQPVSIVATEANLTPISNFYWNQSLRQPSCQQNLRQRRSLSNNHQHWLNCIGLLFAPSLGEHVLGKMLAVAIHWVSAATGTSPKLKVLFAFITIAPWITPALSVRFNWLAHRSWHLTSINLEHQSIMHFARCIVYTFPMQKDFT